MAVINDLRDIPSRKVDREKPDLSGGGLIVLALGRGGDVPTDYAFHPQVRPIEFWKATGKTVEDQIPAQTRVVIFGDGLKLPRDIFGAIHEVLKKRRLPYLIRDNAESSRAAIADILDQAAMNRPKLVQPALPAAPETAPSEPHEKETAPRGSIKALIEKHVPLLLKTDATMPTAELSRRLFRIAQDDGTSTTLASLAQQIRQFKRAHGVGERPESLRSVEDLTLSKIDDAIARVEFAVAGLKQIRVAYEAALADAAKAKAQLAKAREVFSAFQGDVFEEQS